MRFGEGDGWGMRARLAEMRRSVGLRSSRSAADAHAMRLQLALTVLLAAGCAQPITDGSGGDGLVFEDGALACLDPSGKYDAVYAKRDGDCAEDAPFIASHVIIDRSYSLLLLTEKFATHDVVTASEVDGCEVGFKQDVIYRQAMPIMHIEAETRATLEGTILGTAEVWELDEELEPTCMGRYDVELTPIADEGGQQ